MDINTLSLPPKRGCVYIGTIDFDMRMDELPFCYTLGEFEEWIGTQNWISLKFGKTSAYDDAGCIAAAKGRLSKWRRKFYPGSKIDLLAVYQHNDASRTERRVLDVFNNYRNRSRRGYRLEMMTLGYLDFLNLLAYIQKQDGGRWIYDKTGSLSYRNLLLANELSRLSTTTAPP